jgi:peptide deformylase
MSLRDIHVLGSPVLRQSAAPVPEITDEIRRLAADMFETMYAAKGIGLAAPQVGVSLRLAVLDVDDKPTVIINPEVVRQEGAEKGEEGCLSIPEVYGDVERAQKVLVRALDLEGRSFEIEATDLLARCLLHEIDHLEGRLFIDHLSFLKRRSALDKWAKQRKGEKGHVRTLTPTEAAAHHHRDEEL